MSDAAIIIDPLDENGEPKSAKQIEKEMKKAAKLQKLQQKLDKKSVEQATVKENKVEVIHKLSHSNTLVVQYILHQKSQCDVIILINTTFFYFTEKTKRSEGNNCLYWNNKTR